MTERKFTEHQFLVAYLAVSGLIVVGLVKLGHWPVWAALLLTLVLAGAPGLAVAWGKRGSQDLGHEETSAAASRAGDLEQHPTDDIRLRSGRDDYYFIFSATACWHTIGDWVGRSSPTARAAAIDLIVRRAQEAAAEWDPADISVAEIKLRRVLSEPRDDENLRIRAWADPVKLRLSDRDRERLDDLANGRKDVDLWESHRSLEISKRRYLGDDVLQSPASALVWWLAKHETEIGKTQETVIKEAVDKIVPLGQLSAAATGAGQAVSLDGLDGTEAPPNGAGQGWSFNGAPPSPADGFGALLQALGITDDDTRVLLTDQVADLVGHHNRSAADDLRSRFGNGHPDGAGVDETDAYETEDDR
jgi:hypothetical protein